MKNQSIDGLLIKMVFLNNVKQNKKVEKIDRIG